MAVYNISGEMLNMVYDSLGNALQTAYDVDGDVVYTKSTGKIDYTDYTISNYVQVTLSPTQGFDIFGDTIFQFVSSSGGNKMTTIDIPTQTIINSNITADSSHGDSASFSNEFYDTTDEYPLIYVTADTNPAKVFVNRVTDASSTLIKTYKFPIDKTGYYAALCLDEDNDRMYMVGYSEQNYQTDNDGANKTVVSIWDMAQLTDNSDGTYTPMFVSSYERPFIYTMQGQQYHDNMLWISSGGTGVRGYVYALDPNDGTLLYTIDTNTSTEIEGIAFVSDTEMIFGLQGGTYKKVTFARN